MQEHIRRAHPEYYIPKLPATKESFDLMINTPPHERPPQDTHGNPLPLPTPAHPDPATLSPAFTLDQHHPLSSFDYHPPLGHHDGGYYTAGDAEAAAIYSSMQAQHRTSDEMRRGSLIPAASAAQALAQLHYHRPVDDWGHIPVPVSVPVADGHPHHHHHMAAQVIPSSFPPILRLSPTNTEADFLQTFYADPHHNHELKAAFHPHPVDPALDDDDDDDDNDDDDDDDNHNNKNHHSHNHTNHNYHQHPTTTTISSSSVGLLPDPILPFATGAISSPPQPRSRPRKSSITQQARLAKHERRKSREHSHHPHKRHSGERKAFSAEPIGHGLTSAGRRWEDLLEAATSATEEEDGSRDLTPVRCHLSSPSPTPLFPPHIPSSSQFGCNSPFRPPLLPPGDPGPVPNSHGLLSASTRSPPPLTSPPRPRPQRAAPPSPLSPWARNSNHFKPRPSNAPSRPHPARPSWTFLPYRAAVATPPPASPHTTAITIRPTAEVSSIWRPLSTPLPAPGRGWCRFTAQGVGD